MKLSEEINYNIIDYRCVWQLTETEAKLVSYIDKEILPRIKQLETENEKLKQEKTDILNTLKAVNEIRDKLRAEKKELRKRINKDCLDCSYFKEYHKHDF